MRVTLRKLTRDGDGVPGYLAYPTTPQRRPGIIILHHASGVTADYKLTAVELARQGFVAVVPSLYQMLGVPGTNHIGRGAELQQRLNDGEFLRVIGDAWRFLARRPDVDPARTGAIGFAMGGRLAIPFAADTAELRALVLYYPSIRDEPPSDLRPRHAFDVAGQIKCPVMVMYGGRDHITTLEMQKKLGERLLANGQPMEWHFFSGANQGFATAEADGYQPAFAALTWPLVIDFLQRTLLEPTVA